MRTPFVSVALLAIAAMQVSATPQGGLAVGGAGTAGTVPDRMPAPPPCAGGAVLNPSYVFVFMPAQDGQEISICRDGDLSVMRHFGTAAVVDPYGSVIETEMPDGQGGVIVVTTPRHKYESYGNHWWRHGIALGQSTKLMVPISGLLNGPSSSVPATHGSDLETEWTSGGATHRVRTPVKPGELPEATWDRHALWVQAGMNRFPPDQPKTSILVMRGAVPRAA